MAVLLVALALAALCLPAAAQRRVALVVGNAGYADKPLVNPVNDAADMAEALRRLSFEVLARSDRNPQQLRQDLADFQDLLRPGDVALFYFAGHGVQTPRGNHLLPVGVPYRRQRDVELHALEAAAVLRRMEEAGAGLSLVILDACRDSPLPAEERGGRSRGLGRMDAPIGSLIAFATAPGRTADENRQGRNGLYTQYLLRHIETPGLRIEDVFKRVRTDVEAAGRALPPERRQSPEEVSKLKTDFYFRTDVAPPPLRPPAGSPGVSLADLQREQEARAQWQAWQGRMRADFDQAVAASGGWGADLKLRAWERFLSAWKDDNPLSTDDEALRAQAQQRLDEARRAIQVALAPAHAPQAMQISRPLDKPCAECPELVAIAGGSYLMGSPTTEPERTGDEGPQRWVQVSAFAIGKTEVTQGEWRAVMGNNPSRIKNCGNECPVDGVTWNDVQEFINRLNQRTGQQYRLPSEAEWEYAAKAGTSTAFHTGNTITTAQANVDGNYMYNGGARSKSRGRSIPVGSLGTPNAWGLHDMHGNAKEWVQDCYGPYSQAPSDGTAQELAACETRVLRGGSWDSDPKNARSSIRKHARPDFRTPYESVGFRIARTP